MGIQGLLPLLKNVTENINVEEFEGQTLAIDASCWLHRGAYLCATELCLGRPTNKYAIWCMKRIFMLKKKKIFPHVVFDGAQMPLKKNTESKRRESREDSLKKGLAFHQEGNMAMATKHFQRAVRVSSSMVCTFIQMLRDEGVKFTVAPYEADAQLAYLARTGKAAAVISEDSDLLAFGCRKVIFKMDDHGTGQLIRLERIVGQYGLLRPFKIDKFRQMCILAGCDYLPSINGIGTKTACTMLRQTKNINRLFKKIRWGMKYKIPNGYEKNFELAELGFCHQRVFDPETEKIVHLTPLPFGFGKRFTNDDFLGEMLEDDLGKKVAYGLYDPRSRKPYPKNVLEILDPGASSRDTCPVNSELIHSQTPWGPLSNATKVALASLKRKFHTSPKVSSGTKKSSTTSKQTGLDNFFERSARKPLREVNHNSCKFGLSTKASSLLTNTYSSTGKKPNPLNLQGSKNALKPFRMPRQTADQGSSFFENKEKLQMEKNMQDNIRKACGRKRSASRPSKFGLSSSIISKFGFGKRSKESQYNPSLSASEVNLKIERHSSTFQCSPVTIQEDQFSVSGNDEYLRTTGEKIHADLQGLEAFKSKTRKSNPASSFRSPYISEKRLTLSRRPVTAQDTLGRVSDYKSSALHQSNDRTPMQKPAGPCLDREIVSRYETAHKSHRITNKPPPIDWLHAIEDDGELVENFKQRDRQRRKFSSLSRTNSDQLETEGPCQGRKVEKYRELWGLICFLRG